MSKPNLGGNCCFCEPCSMCKVSSFHVASFNRATAPNLRGITMKPKHAPISVDDPRWQKLRERFIRYAKSLEKKDSEVAKKIMAHIDDLVAWYLPTFLFSTIMYLSKRAKATTHNMR